MATKLILYFLDFNQKNIFNYFSIGKQGQKIEINKDTIEMDLDYSEFNHYCHIKETFKLFCDNKIEDIIDKNMKYFDLDLYINQINQYYCFINYINNFSFDVIIIWRDGNCKKKLLKIKPDKIFKLDKCNSFGLKRCVKFGIINCDKSYFPKYNKNFPSSCTKGSYYLNVFYTSKSKDKKVSPKISLHLIRNVTPKKIEFEQLSDKQRDFLLNVKDKLVDLYNKYSKDFVPSKKYEFLNSLKDLYLKNKDNFPMLDNIRFLLARDNNLKLSEEEYNICLGYCIYIFIKKFHRDSESILFTKILLNLLNDLQKNLGNYNLYVLRILFWYQNEYLSNVEFQEKIEVTQRLDIPDDINNFKLCFLKKCEKNTPYNNAYTFMEKFIDKLDEESYLLEILYLIDSEASSNRIYNNCRLFQFSLLSLEQIKSHLKLLLPEVIIRYEDCPNKDSNGSFIIEYGVVRVYEKELFKHVKENLNKCMLEEDKEYKYSIPLIMLFFHECFGHGKLRIRFEGSESPNYLYNPYDNYELSYHDENGESGRLIEFYISSDMDTIRFLKYSMTPLPELSNVDLWVKPNLNELRKIISEKMKNFDMSSIKDQLIKAFPKGEKEENIEFANDKTGYDSDIYSSLYENDQKKNILKSKFKKTYEISCK